MIIERVILVAALVVIPLLVVWSVVRYEVGPVEVVITAEHGVHAFDLVVLAVALPLWLSAATRLVRILRSSQ